MLARGRTVGAGARGGGGQGHGVDVSRGAHHEEVGFRPVEEAEGVAECPEYPVHHRLGHLKRGVGWVVWRGRGGGEGVHGRRKVVAAVGGWEQL